MIPAGAAAVRAQNEWQRVMDAAPPPDGEVQAILMTQFGPHAVEAARERAQQRDTAA